MVGCVSSETGGASTLSQLIKTNIKKREEFSSANVTHTNSQEEAFGAQGNISWWTRPPCIAHSCKILQSCPLCPPQSRMFAAKIFKYLTLAGTMHSSLFLFFFFFPGVLCITLQKGCQSQVKKLPFSLQIYRNPNTAECHQSQLSHIQGKNGSSAEGTWFARSLLGLWETSREKLSCIARWKAMRRQTVGANRCCLLRAMDETASIVAWQSCK